MQSEATVSGILMELQRFQGLVWVMAALAGMAEKIGEIPRVEPSPVHFGHVLQGLRQRYAIPSERLTGSGLQPFRGRKPGSKPAPEKPTPAPVPVRSAG
jgi:hypothetical protein